MCTEIAKYQDLDYYSDRGVTKYELRAAAPRILRNGQPSGVRYMWSCTVSTRHTAVHVGREYLSILFRNQVYVVTVLWDDFVKEFDSLATHATNPYWSDLRSTTQEMRSRPCSSAF